MNKPKSRSPPVDVCLSVTRGNQCGVFPLWIIINFKTFRRPKAKATGWFPRETCEIPTAI